MTILISRDTLHSICSGPVETSAAVKGSDNDGMQLKTIEAIYQKLITLCSKQRGEEGWGGVVAVDACMCFT